MDRMSMTSSMDIMSPRLTISIAQTVYDQVDLMDIIGLQKSDDTVRVADGGDLRRGDDQSADPLPQWHF